MSTTTGAARAGLSLKEFFAEARGGRLVVQRCAACGTLAVPPRAFCAECQGAAWERAPLAGDGEIASYTVIRVPPAPLVGQAPYAIAVVRFPEGASLLGRVADLPLERLRVGLPVRYAGPADPAAEPPVLTFVARG
ncbi:MAG: Zn-ribbon domain-containing OB-fold protein [Candidatus Rokuibacteriota bacterium]